MSDDLSPFTFTDADPTYFERGMVIEECVSPRRRWFFLRDGVRDPEWRFFVRREGRGGFTAYLFLGRLVLIAGREPRPRPPAPPMRVVAVDHEASRITLE